MSDLPPEPLDLDTTLAMPAVAISKVGVPVSCILPFLYPGHMHYISTLTHRNLVVSLADSQVSSPVGSSYRRIIQQEACEHTRIAHPLVCRQIQKGNL